jgi:undecaprenyl-diphosphatase
MRNAYLALATFERRLLVRANRVNLRPAWRQVFETASRLGDGPSWLLLALLLALSGGPDGRIAALRMAGAGLVCTLLYTAVKHGVRRPRPCHALDRLHLSLPPLDRFSFPSGHTMHACAFTWIALASFPALALLLVPFTLLVAASRLVLGLHWLSDVLVGGALGCALGQLALDLG